ncbi:hypothetical protein FRC11_003792 [Ceratobasidium sp. 423]|nr:hypothetical protein FRC11_003792 [Ceratobasidium sp. 423]
MPPALAMRSYPSSSHSSSPYSTSTPRASSMSVAQARSHRFAGQGQYWSTPQPQVVAGTFSDNSAASNSAYETSLNDDWTRNGTLAVSSYNNGFVSTPAPKISMSVPTGLDQAYQADLAPQSTHRGHLPSRSPPQNPPKSSGSYAGASDYRASPYPTPVPSTTFSNAFSSPSSQTSPFTRAAEMPSSEPDHAGASLTSLLHRQPPATQYQTGFDSSYPTSFGGAYHASTGPESTYSELSEPPQVQPSYSDQHSYYPAYDDRRGSIASSLSGYPQSCRTGEPQNNSVYDQPAEQNPTTTSPPNSTSPPMAHTPSPHQASSVPEPTSPRPHGVGSTEAVRRRVGIMLHSQKCQQTEQTKRTSIKRSSDGRRGKRSPTRNDSEAEEGMDPLVKYKTAYERVRLQRDFFERAASSLVHQVNMLGGDPMQSSRRAAKGEDLDPKGARILVASLQHELETLREKLIKTQKDVCALFSSPITDDSSRALRRSVSGGYFLDKEDDNVPLSAAPVTIYSHSRRQ